MGCVQSVSFSVLINREPSRTLTPSRGLRQGDLISLFFFLLCAEGFSGLLDSGSANLNFTGLKIYRHCPTVSHLFFAHDNILFFNATTINDSKIIYDILDRYFAASGQVINFNKSMMMTSKNTSPKMAREISRFLNIKVTLSLENYLGLPSTNDRNKSRLFNLVLNKVRTSLQGWNNKLFSSGGKEVLIKAVIQAILVFTMSSVKFPDSVCKQFDSLCANFWWGLKGRYPQYSLEELGFNVSKQG